MSAIGIAGVGGRMGRMLVQAVVNQPGCRLVAACERIDSGLIGQEVGGLAGLPPLGVLVTADDAAFFQAAQVVIDFTVPQATLAHVEVAVAQGCPLVIGTTGFSVEEQARIRAAAERIPIVWAPNFSVGVNLMFRVAAEVAKVLGESFDIEIVEAHHRHKVDAPSGTALRLGEAIAAAVGKELPRDGVYARQGVTGARPPGSIGFATVRGGDIVGDHTVLFAGEGERFEITHRASSRLTFAAGAVRAACWLQGRPPGLYDMQHILGL